MKLSTVSGDRLVVEESVDGLADRQWAVRSQFVRPGTKACPPQKMLDLTIRSGHCFS